MPESAISNERTLRHEMWRRYDGDDWAAFDALPTSIRRRVTEHAYDAWSVNVMILWQHYKRIYCERLEREAFAARYGETYGMTLPHDAAAVPVLR